MKNKRLITELLKTADVEINGTRPWDTQVHNEKLYDRVIYQGSLGLGESYMDGWWDVEDLDEFFNKVLRANLGTKINFNLATILAGLKATVFNLAKIKSHQVGEDHYDIGNDLYRRMLDKRMVYTCGYWKNAKTLDEAQEAKLDLVCRKIGLKEGDKLLDIGSGWGSFINFAAERYGAECVGLTVSKEQADLANSNRFNDKVETRVMDYRDINEKFDKIVSLGMFEHVGRKNYRFYMKKVHSLLKDDGLFLLHTIGKDKPSLAGDAWFSKYIFPNSMLPSHSQISKAASGLFVMEDWHNFGAYYDTTLMQWWENFNSSWDEIKDKYGKRFYRMWKYYLLSSAGSFRARRNSLYQIVFSKKGVVGGYKSIR